LLVKRVGRLASKLECDLFTLQLTIAHEHNLNWKVISDLIVTLGKQNIAVDSQTHVFVVPDEETKCSFKPAEKHRSTFDSKGAKFAVIKTVAFEK
jgi:hypothetical protein